MERLDLGPKTITTATANSKEEESRVSPIPSNFSYPYNPSTISSSTPSNAPSIKLSFSSYLSTVSAEEDSPFPEVRASVSNIDDPEMPALTFRMWLVGLSLCMASAALNVFFNFRSPAPSVVPNALLLLSYPMGKGLSFLLPIRTYRIRLPRVPKWISRWGRKAPSPELNVEDDDDDRNPPPSFSFSLNPGPWNIKEHGLVFIMANVAISSPYAINAIVVSEIYYNQIWGYWFSVVLVLATQLTGFGLAGVCRRFLVWPASMVWPQNLVACTLLNTLHAEEEEVDSEGEAYMEEAPVKRRKTRHRRPITRYRFFLYLTLFNFLFFFLPGFLFTSLSIFSYICWLAPTNVVVNQLFGVYSGLGMSILTADWTQISWIGSPLMVPWWAQVHIFGGFVAFFWVLTPVLYYTNSWDLSYFPISDNQPYDRFGNPYNITRVLTTDDIFNQTAYEEYSPLYLPATYAVCYLIAFALSTCVITHTLLYHGKALLAGVKRIRVESDDIHAKLMRSYPEVPDWWYLLSIVTFFSLAIVAVEVWHADVPVWALLLAILLPVIYILPSGFIYAMTGQGITLNIVAQIIPGTLLPGNPMANMVFKAYSVQTLSEATSFVQDLKLGHYIKIPPRATFLVQLVSTILASFVQVGVKQWIFANVPDICQPDQKSQLTCPHNQVFFTASAIWGLIGPTRQFGTGSPYHPHLYAIAIGAVLPIPFWLWQRRYPGSWIRYVSTPVILNGVSAIPPATGINYSSWFAFGFVFQYLIRKRNFAWWAKFNYVTSAALDCGTVISLIFIFFTLQFPKAGSIFVNWWGNTVYTNTADFLRTPLKTIPNGGL
ncbi:OPT oligopeptide transporter protein-domain-containing protein [Lentinula raphanica]|uniref:OPT oligopeptide transporter protein-domain-containing protein n=1 Tax=Lentinula raphanica TaxID=153919 RepID=A0AA38P400_9AGAR|nr:OPT oligopeptide transporter protein-domain-containing protein [Lentinula raphanica]KAJ3835750.1 OPT oligopeptide transporter protein-domain-containing protein [Lentinula raphanica]KAJ3968815.1 OPT oligopeptide transporter protein-domain-containing protein [Lentinula raphanica]